MGFMELNTGVKLGKLVYNFEYNRCIIYVKLGEYDFIFVYTNINKLIYA
jgi:hypothetical protein